MTRKDFDLIAAAFRDALTDQPGNSIGRDRRHGIEDAALILSRRLYDTHDRFDQRRFLLACGLDAGTLNLSATGFAMPPV